MGQPSGAIPMAIMSPTPLPSTPSGGAPVAPKPPQQMQQQHAITYVTNIRNRFSNEPETYRYYKSPPTHTPHMCITHTLYNYNTISMMLTYI